MQGAVRFGEDRADSVIGGFISEGENSTRPVRMSEQEKVILSTWAGKEMRAFGYRENPVRLSSQDTFRLYALDGPVNVIGALLWNVSKKV